MELSLSMTANDVFVVWRGQNWSPVMLDSQSSQHTSSLPDIQNSPEMTKDPIILSVRSLPQKTEDKVEVRFLFSSLTGHFLHFILERREEMFVPKQFLCQKILHSGD